MSRFACRYNDGYDTAVVEELCAKLHVQPLTARALIRRGLTREEDALRFLRAHANPLADPFAMSDVQKAVERLRLAFVQDETICVYGDYDADGICATALLLDCFSIYTDRLTAYIPSRHDEGYGMRAASVKRLREEGVDLIVTVDNGVSAYEEIALCASLGMDVIVTDHHSLPEKLPECAALVTPGDGACGAGVALRLARALAGDAHLDRWLPLAALATVADVVPLTGDNRTLVARGIPLMEENMGLNALLRAAGNGDNPVDATTLAFLLAPRLNAAGRLGDAMRGVRLLRAQDIATANKLAAELNEANAQRRAIEADIFAEAEAMIAARRDNCVHALLLKSVGWNVGVIGIVASRLSEKHHCPTILFCEDDAGVLTGSGRSAGEIDLYQALSACSRHFIRFGGHKGAAGVTMEAARFDAFCADFSAYLEEHYSEEDFVPVALYDESVALGELTLSAVSELKLLAPFGEANPEPVYRLDGVRLTEQRMIGQGARHISARAVSRGASLRLVGFGFGDRLDELKAPGEWTILARPGVHAYRGVESVELLLIDAENGQKLFDAFFRNVLYNNVCVEEFGFPDTCGLDKQDFSSASMRRMFVTLKNSVGTNGAAADGLLTRLEARELCALMVFLELGFFACAQGVVRLVPDANKRVLTESRLYRQLQPNDEREESSWI